MRQLTNAVGTVTLARSYEPFGKLLSIAGNPLTKYGYTGEWTDPTNLIYLRVRYYDPATGRFISKDPVRGIATIPQTLNPYTYALNNPILYSDPSGEIIPLLLFAAVGLGGGVLGGLGYYGLETWLGGDTCAQWDWGEAAFWGITGGVLGIPLGLGAGWLGSLAGWWGGTSAGASTGGTVARLTSSALGKLGVDRVFRFLSDPTAQREVSVYVNEGGKRANLFARFDILTSTAIHEVKNVANLSLAQDFMDQAYKYKLIADSAGLELHYWLINDAPQHVYDWLVQLGISVHTIVP